ncbi:hypothetical protein M409DRAFT_30668 [Zasmidium cellare ATCC 36951]|uniref:Uncharacterized protein n=1 Tax=Zasmidium cellare ATCC 36951 TaxID=1080233 RepID=A0A6A6BVS3_ZASCE|nr:uncharacterized protein M409DRAFT_30668 [Zasmidium cellare ATCC 36951]KAF2158881.1 hypothetical protein M409DRAFT_30668 [Zasmidium cellare ATCC 36951]
MDTNTSKPHLLNLPYDIRFLIYQHLFPAGKQMYLQAYGKPRHGLKSIMGDHPVTVPLLRVCRLLNSEGSDYLYNTYLWNIVGRKYDVLAHYGRFLTVLERYANDEVHVDAFTNGWHSSTMCVSLHTGEGKKAMLSRRDRGVAKSIEEVWEEVRLQPRRKTPMPLTVMAFMLEAIDAFGWYVIFAVGVVFALLAWTSSAESG